MPAGACFILFVQWLFLLVLVTVTVAAMKHHDPKET